MNVLGLIITLLCSVLLICIIMHVVTVASVDGYKNYLEYIRLLKSFKHVDYKVTYESPHPHYYSTGGVRTIPTSIGVVNYNAFYFTNGYNLLQATYKSRLFMEFTIKVAKQKYNHDKKEWGRMDYTIYKMNDLVYLYYYKRLERMINKAESTHLNSEDELYDAVDNAKLKKFRLNNLDTLLDD